MATKDKPFVTSQKMLDWQYFQILGELQEIQRHDSDVTCPCRLSDDLGENCLAKHTLGLSVLAAETSAMDSANKKMLDDLTAEAKDLHLKMKGFLCHTANEPEFTNWSRQWRKRIEPLYYHASCKVKLNQEICILNQANLERPMVIPKEQMGFDFEALKCKGPVCNIAPSPAPVPGKKKFELFQYQAEGVAWLKGRSFALLADDMGLGKTPQAIYWGADNLPALVVVPAALPYNWQREIAEMWRPGDSTVVLDGNSPFPSKLPDWTICSYGQLPKFLPRLKKAGFQCIIIDEAHLVKNMQAQRTKNLLALVAPSKPEAGERPIPKRLAVTGTPILNRPIELFALLVFLGIKKLHEYTDFVKTYTETKSYQGRTIFVGVKNMIGLNFFLKSFMLRRMKKDVLNQLPPKTNTPMFVAITNKEEYLAAERNFLTWLRQTAGDEAAARAAKAEIITRMNHLRQLAAIGKVGAVCDWLKPCYDGQGKVILFSTFPKALENIRDCKGDKGAIVYDGTVSSQDRQKMVDAFQKGPNCYFYGTIGAAGVGITLTAANRVAFLDLPWTPGGKAQAEDRSWRIGQKRPVEIVNFLARGTIDERMLAILAEKEKVIAQAIDGKTAETAKETSIADSLMNAFLSNPTFNQRVEQYQPEERDPDVDQVEIAEGFRQEVEPWQLTLKEYRAAIMAGKMDFKLLGSNKDYASDLVRRIKNAKNSSSNVAIEQEVFDRATEGEHAAAVAIAVADGKPVSPKVVKDHPGLLKKGWNKPDAVSISGHCGNSADTCEFAIKHKGSTKTVTKEVKQTEVKTCKVNDVAGVLPAAKNLLSKNSCTLHQEPTVKIAGNCTLDGCSLKVKGAIETIASTDASGLSEAINASIHHFDKKKESIVTSKTFAPGISTNNRYDFEFKVIDASDLIVSHDPVTFEPNPKYISKIQPRLRDRLANQMQVKKIAARLDPEKLLMDTHAIDTGSPIVGPDNIVECGNGRVLALQIAEKEHPANIVLYKMALKDIAGNYGLTVPEKMKMPVLVRLRLTPVDRQAFAEECNARPTIETSAIEKARTDSDKITPAMLQSLEVLEGEPIEKALRAERNKQFVVAYLSKLPENEQALLIDARGYLNSDGIRRMVMGIFTATFKGTVGIRLAEKFFEAIDETGVKNAFNGILRSLGIIAQAETLVASGAREPGLAFGEDLAKAITAFSNIRGADMTVANYLKQQAMFERELTPFQEKVLVALDENTRSAKRVGNLLTYYAQSVIDSTPPGQVSLIPMPKPDKAALFDAAAKRVQDEAEAERLARKQKEPEAVAMSQSPKIKNLAELDTYRNTLSVNGGIPSRYWTLKHLYGEDRADKIMRELEVGSWDLTRSTVTSKKIANVRQEFTYSEHSPASITMKDNMGIIPPEYDKFKVQLELKRAPDWNIKDAPRIDKVDKVQNLFRLMRFSDREWALIICLDTRLRLVGLFEMAIGTPDSAPISPLEVARIAVHTGAVSLIMAHNHPSGDPDPSNEDRMLYERLKKTLKELSIDMPEFMVVGHKSDYSFASNAAWDAPYDQVLAKPEPARVIVPPDPKQGRLMQDVPIWAITSEQYVKNEAEKTADQWEVYKNDPKEKARYIQRFIRRQGAAFRTIHRRVVATALNARLPVPAEVLAEYPDLKEHNKPTGEYETFKIGNKSFNLAPEIKQGMNFLATNTLRTGKEFGMDICQKNDGVLITGMTCKGSACKVYLHDCAGLKKVADYHTHPPHVFPKSDPPAIEESITPSKNDIELTPRDGFSCVGSPITNKVNCWTRNEQHKPFRCPGRNSWAYIPEGMNPDKAELLFKSKRVCTGVKDAFDFASIQRNDLPNPVMTPSTTSKEVSAESLMPSTGKQGRLFQGKQAKLEAPSAAKFRELAVAMQKQIDEKRDPGVSHQNVTARRSRIASNMAADADRLEETQKAMFGMAEAMDAGTLPAVLSRISNRAQVDQILHRSKYFGPYVRQDSIRSLESVVRFDDPWRKDWTPAARELVEKLKNRKSENDWTIDLLNDDEVALVEKIIKFGGLTYVGDIAEGKRFWDIGIRSQGEFDQAKAALKAYVSGPSPEVLAKKKQRELESKIIGIKMPGFFPTPRKLAEEVVYRAMIEPGMEVLEPSAGIGSIADVVKEKCPTCKLTLVEISRTMIEILQSKGYNPNFGDFLGYGNIPEINNAIYDRIVMNPPFEHAQDVDHVKHAYELLKPGGRLVAIMGEHCFFGAEKKCSDFRDWLDTVGESEKLPPGSFTGAEAFVQTGTAARIVTIDKPKVAEIKPIKPVEDFSMGDLVDYHGEQWEIGFVNPGGSYRIQRPKAGSIYQESINHVYPQELSLIKKAPPSMVPSYTIPDKQAASAGKPVQGRLFSYDMIKKLLDHCNLTDEQLDAALNYRPLRNLVATAIGWVDVKVQLCEAGLVKSVYQATLTGLTEKNDEKILHLVKNSKEIKQVYTKVKGHRVFEVVVPESRPGDVLEWKPQEITRAARSLEPAEQARMFKGKCPARTLLMQDNPKAEMHFDPLLSAISCQIGIGCMASSKETSKLSVCLPDQKKRREEIIRAIKRTLPVGCNSKEWNKPLVERKEGCVNPFAIASVQVGCRLGRKGEVK